MSGSTGATRREDETKRDRTGLFVATIVLALVVIGALIAFLFIIGASAPKEAVQNIGDGDQSLAFLFGAFAAGTVIIFGVLFLFAALGRWISGNNQTERGALSLPHGSISAVLALIILVVFSVTSIHIYSELRAGEDFGVESAGVTQEALNALPGDRVLHIEPEAQVDGQPATYTVTLSNPHENSTVFAADLMTIFSTLLIAIVGFYFGQGATATGVREATKLKLGKKARENSASGDQGESPATGS